MNIDIELFMNIIPCSWKGVRGDLKIFMDTDIADVNLCALHCELRNMEQLLAQLGLLANGCGSLKQCNEILAEYGPETMVKDRIVVKMKENQDFDVGKHNIKIRSFSGKCVFIFPFSLLNGVNICIYSGPPLIPTTFGPNKYGRDNGVAVIAPRECMTELLFAR